MGCISLLFLNGHFRDLNLKGYMAPYHASDQPS